MFCAPTDDIIGEQCMLSIDDGVAIRTSRERPINDGSFKATGDFEAGSSPQRIPRLYGRDRATSSEPDARSLPHIGLRISSSARMKTTP